MSTREATSTYQYAVEMVRRTRSMSPAPKYCETMMPDPMVTPITRATSRKMMEKLDPTAASACLPTNCPTTHASVRL